MTDAGTSTAMKSPAADPGRLLRVAMLVLAAAAIVFAIWMWRRALSDRAIAFLPAYEGIEWLRHDEPPALETRNAGSVARGFRTVLTLTAAPAAAVLEVRAMKRLNLLVDGKVIAAPNPNPAGWKLAQRFPLTPLLTPGRHEVTLLVQNEGGPAVLWVRFHGLGDQTVAPWESSADGVTWRPARRASERPALPIADAFPSPAGALLARGVVFILVFVFVAVISFSVVGRLRMPAWATSAAHVRWLLLAAWGALASNNILKLPEAAGFDVSGHLDYIAFILKNHGLPLAPDGWQMFQSPLNYLISAPLYLLLEWLSGPPNAMLLLRLLPLGCGLLQIEACYRATRRVFPQRNDLQIIGTLFGATLPMNLYLSHFVGNEPLAGALSATAFVLSLQLLLPAPGENGRWTPLWLGLALGLALLAKVSAIVMAVPVGLAIGLASLVPGSGHAGGVARAARSGAVVFGVAAVVSGWYYVRNLIHLGRPFVGGWDPDRGINWWQDPGFRTAADFNSFGLALTRPVYAGFHSFWDGVYATLWSDSFLSSAIGPATAPGWNHGFVSASVLLALVPTAALLLGVLFALRSVWRRAQPAWLIVLVAVGGYGSALFYHALTLPYYCAIKAFYTIGAMPAYALLVVAGSDGLSRHRPTRAVFHGLLACWSLAVYTGYFARS